jgi:hypothetical protein
VRFFMFLVSIITIGCSPRGNLPERAKARSTNEKSNEFSEKLAKNTTSNNKELDEKDKGKPPGRLYTDAEVEKLVGDGIDNLKDGNAIPLDVVPSGSAFPLKDVLKSIHVEQDRLRDRRGGMFMNTGFLVWQISPSYDISFMSGIHGAENMQLGIFDPKRKVYGVRIEKHWPE